MRFRLRVPVAPSDGMHLHLNHPVGRRFFSFAPPLPRTLAARDHFVVQLLFAHVRRTFRGPG